MTLDNEAQRGQLLEMIARAFRTPEEVPVVEGLRVAISNAAVAEPDGE